MERKLKLPIGIENFEKLRTEGFYYVDKSGLIMELLENWGEVGGRLPGSSGADRSPGYEDRLEDDGIGIVIKYGIACCRKRCRVVRG